MLKQFIELKRTDEFPLLGPNIWFMRKIGLILPKNTLWKSLCILFHQIATCFNISQFIELYIIRDDKDSITKNFNVTIYLFISVLKTSTILYWQKEWLDVIDYVTEADKFERHTQNPARGDVINKYTRLYSKLTYYYIILVIFGEVITVFTPKVVKYLISPSFREMVYNGTEPFPYMLSAWTPYDDRRFPLGLITMVWQACVSLIFVAETLVFDLTTVGFMLFFAAEFDMLRLRSADLMGGPTPVSEEEFDERVRLLHSLHTKLVKNTQRASSLVSPVMLMYVSSCGLMLCVVAFQLTNTTSMTQKMLMLDNLIFEVMQLFLYCWMSNNVQDKSSQLALGLYESAWYAAGVRRRRVCLLLAGQMSATVVFRAGPFFDLNLATFTAIIKGAYSYYTLLRN